MTASHLLSLAALATPTNARLTVLPILIYFLPTSLAATYTFESLGIDRFIDQQHGWVD